MCPQCLAEIDVDQNLFNGKATDVLTNDEKPATPSPQPPSLPTPPALPSTPPPISTQQAKQPQTSTPPAQPPHIDDVLRYCKHCGAFLREGVNFCPKCGKYVRVSAPPPKPAQQEAARLRANTQPARQVPQNKQSTYKPPQQSTYQSPTVKQQRYSNSSRNSRNTSNNGSKPSKFSILSVSGCLSATIVAVALFFIIYIIIGVTYE